MNIVPPVIREAVPTEAPVISEIVTQYWVFEGIEGYDVEGIESLLRAALELPERARCWVAESNGTVVGYLLAVLVFSLEHRGVMAEVDEFFVVPEAHGTGVGAALLRHAEQALSSRGVVRLQLQLGVMNARARGFYERNGYTRRRGYELWDKSISVVWLCAALHARRRA